MTDTTNKEDWVSPPKTEVGVIGWMRKNLFSNWFNSVLTLIALYLILTTVPGIIEWALINSVWGDKSPEVCREAQGACWSFIYEKYRFILFGALSMLLPYFINLIYPIPLGHRFLLFAIFFLHLAMIWAALDLIQRLAQTGAASLAVKLAAGFMGTVLAGGLAFNVAFAQFDYRRHVANWQPVPATIGKVVQSVPANGVVMAQPMLAWPIPTFGGKVISLFHPNPMVPDQADRKRDVARFFDAETPVAQRRHILNQYRATHVLIDTTDTADSVLTYLYLNGTITETMDTLQLIALSSPSS